MASEERWGRLARTVADGKQWEKMPAPRAFSFFYFTQAPSFKGISPFSFSSAEAPTDAPRAPLSTPQPPVLQDSPSLDRE